jgi:hypothetical protein
MTRRPGLPPSSYTEKEWQHQVEELLDLYGWDYRYHVGRTQYAPWGWPDIVALRRRDRRILFAELKTATGTASMEQLGLLEILLDVSGGGWTNAEWGVTSGFAAGHARVDVELWRPGDIDRVMKVLK